MRRIGITAARTNASSGRPGYAKSLETRARILAAALEEAGATGLHGASVARIAARAGVAVGILNYHFGSRGEMLRELMGSLMTDLLPRLHAVEADDSADFFERERAGLLAYLDYLRANPAHMRLANEIQLYDPALYRRAVAAWVERIATRIRDGIARGDLKAMDATEVSTLAHFLLGASKFLEHMIGERRYSGDRAVVDVYIALLRDGLRVHTRARGRTRSVRSPRAKANKRKPATRERGRTG